MASVEKYEIKSGTRYMARWRDSEGKQRLKRGFHRRRDALAYGSELEVAKAKGQYLGPENSRVSFRMVAEEWFDSLVHLKPTTRNSYRHHLDSRILRKFGNREIGSITHAELQRWVTELSKELKASSLRYPVHVVSAVLSYAIKTRRIGHNPSDDLNLPRVVRDEKAYLTHGQVETLAQGVANDYRALIYVLAYSGLRIGEAIALRVRDVDLDRRRLSVHRAAAETGGQLVMGTPKSHEKRSVPLPAFVAEMMRDHMNAEVGPNDLVFPGTRGAMIRPNNFRKRVFGPAVAQSALSDPTFPASLTPHGLRHTCASLAVSAGANVKALQKLLGHASASMTLDRYADLFDSDLDDVAERLDAQRRSQK